MNEKLFRTQFNHMDASEKQKLMEALTVMASCHPAAEKSGSTSRLGSTPKGARGSI